MKAKIIFFSALLGMSAVFSACTDYLDSDYLFKERMSIDDVFTNKDYTNEWLATAYSYLGNNFVQEICSKDYNPFNFCDDMTYADRSGSTNDYSQWRNGIYNEYGCRDNSKQVWVNCYRGIRQAQIFLQNIDKNTLFTANEIADFKGQCNFLIGYFYWYMLRMYGPVPIVTDNTIDYMEQYDAIAQSRNTYDECVDYICNKFVEAARTLPLTRSAQDITRPTRGAALAFRARTLLMAASPLMNGKAPESVASKMLNDKGERLLPATYDESKWAKAAAAAKDVMNLNQYNLYVAGIRTTTTDADAYPLTITPPYDDQFSDQDWPNGWKNIDPFESYRSVFDGELRASENPELIFTHGQNQGGESVAIMALQQLPSYKAGGYNQHGMTLKQLDSYYMADGTDAPGKDSEIGRNTDGTQRVTGYMSDAVRSQYPYSHLPNNVSLQFADREPRFYASVAYNGSVWNLLNFDKNQDEVKDLQVFYYRGTEYGYKGSGGCPRTGIGVKKYIHPDDIGNVTIEGSYKHGRIRDKAETDFRYAEILLSYAEALNELTTSYQIPSWDGSTTYNISRNTDEIKKGIQPVRIRAGVPDYTADIYNDATLFRAKLKRERQIEFFAEGKRYFDLRRWMDAPVEEKIPVWGYNIMATTSMKDVFHTPVMVQEFPCTFNDKMYFWPISQDELKRNKKLTQNPGWTYAE